MVQSVTILSPFAEYHGRKAVDECEEFPLRRDSAPDEAMGRRHPNREVMGASSDFLVGVLRIELSSDAPHAPILPVNYTPNYVFPTMRILP